jgi:hypothetical protein
MNKVLLTCVSVLALGTTAAFANTGAAPGAYVGASIGIGGMDTPKFADEMSQLGYSEKLRDGVTGRIFGGYLWGDAFKYGAEIGASLYPKNEYKLGLNSYSDSGRFN